MPTYEYRCPNGHTFEMFQRMADAPAERCEVCGASPVEKVLFPVAVHFKGSGFYSTDYGRGSRKGTKDGDTAGKSSDSSESKSTEKASSSTDSASSSSGKDSKDSKGSAGD